MNSFLKALMILNVFCFVIIQSQRGGSKSSGSSSSHSSYNSYSSNHYGPAYYTPWTFLDFMILVGVIVLFIPVAYCAYQSQQKKQAQRRAEIKEYFNQYQAKNQGNMCTLDESQKSRAIDWFTNNSWTIEFRLRDLSYQGKCKIKIKDFKNKTPLTYQLQLQGTDDIGSSKLTGVLMFQNDYLGLILQKTYDDKTKAGQTGEYKTLMYEGVQQGEQFTGNWSYKGFETNPGYSGDFRMVHI